MKKYAILLGAVFAGSVAAFTVGSITRWFTGGINTTTNADWNHENITIEALGSPLYWTSASGKKLFFSSSAADELVEANRFTDSKSADVAWVHVDSESVEEANRNIAAAKSEIISKALAGKYAEARTLLGETLHTIQDFYSHTSWIEMGRVDVAPLGGSSLLLLPNLRQSSCDSTGVLPFSKITSGYYDVSQTIVGSTTFIWDAWPPGKCVHGSSTKPNSDLHGKGLNKDSHARTEFPRAYALATQASREFIQSVGDNITGPKRDEALCGLLGQSGNSAVGCSTDTTGVASRWRSKYATVGQEEPWKPFGYAVSGGLLKLPASQSPWGYFWTAHETALPSQVSSTNFRLDVRIKNPQAEGGISAYDIGVSIVSSSEPSKNYWATYMGEAWALSYTSMGAAGVSSGPRTTLVRDLSQWHTISIEGAPGKLITYYDGIKVDEWSTAHPAILLDTISISGKGSFAIDRIVLRSGDRLVIQNDFD